MNHAVKLTISLASILGQFAVLAILGHNSFAEASTAPDRLVEPAPVIADAQKKKRIVVMTYNVQQLGYPNWITNHFEQERLDLIPQSILGIDERPDILILEEVFTEHAFDFLVTSLGPFYPYHTEVLADSCDDKDWTSVGGNCQKASLKHNGGVFILSRWPITERHAYVYYAGCVGSTFDFLAQKGVVYAKISVGEGDQHQVIHVVGTHLQASRRGHDVRMQQIDEMDRWIDQFTIKKEDPIILGGDFNVGSNDSEKLADLLNRSNTILRISTSGFGSLSRDTNQYLKLISPGKTKKTLDYILYRKDHLTPSNRPVLQVINLKSDRAWIGHRIFGADIQMKDLSDHYPTSMAFEF